MLLSREFFYLALSKSIAGSPKAAVRCLEGVSVNSSVASEMTLSKGTLAGSGKAHQDDHLLLVLARQREVSTVQLFGFRTKLTLGKDKRAVGGTRGGGGGYGSTPRK